VVVEGGFTSMGGASGVSIRAARLPRAKTEALVVFASLLLKNRAHGQKKKKKPPSPGNGGDISQFAIFNSYHVVFGCDIDLLWLQLRNGKKRKRNTHTWYFDMVLI
jgi:hypothetical protein